LRLYTRELPEMTPHNEESMKAKTRKGKFKNMNKPNIKQQLRGFFALAIVGVLLTLLKAQA